MLLNLPGLSGNKMDTIYDRIGSNYSLTREPDPRIMDKIIKGLGGCASVVNVGAGAGSYEPVDRTVISVEPSATMIRQRTGGSALVVQGAAEALPLADGAVDAALAILTVHHWNDRLLGLAEMYRVARKRIVVFTWDQKIWETFWLIREYFPCMDDLDRSRALSITDVITALGESRIVTVPIPHDCIDGFHGAFWRRPEAYLDPRIRSGISTYSLMSPEDLNNGLRRLAGDLRSGAWEERHRDLLDLDECDLGYRLIITEGK